MIGEELFINFLEGAISRKEFIRRAALLEISLPTVASFLAACAKEPAPLPVTPETEVKLPEPRYDSDVSIEETLLKRRSVRDYTGESLTLPEVSQLLWADQGITDPRGLRTAPSAGATYPLETYVVVGDVENLTKGVYRFHLPHYKLVKVLDGDLRTELAAAALGQRWVKQGAINIVFTAIYERTTGRYGDRGIRYVHMEVGHLGQNVHLQAVALGLGTVVIGAFRDDQVKEILNLPKDEQPLYIMPVGRI
jgi:SagB-type dehydrogenase family enzyme